MDNIREKVVECEVGEGEGGGGVAISTWIISRLFGSNSRAEIKIGRLEGNIFNWFPGESILILIPFYFHLIVFPSYVSAVNPSAV